MGKRRGNQVSLTRSTTKTKAADQHQAVESSNHQTVKTVKPQNVKTTTYLSQEIADRLDMAQIKLRRLTGKRGHDLSRSAIIEAALRIALDELDAQSDNSTIVALMS